MLDFSQNIGTTYKFELKLTELRSSRPEVFLTNGVLKICSKFEVWYQESYFAQWFYAQ